MCPKFTLHFGGGRNPGIGSDAMQELPFNQQSTQELHVCSSHSPSCMERVISQLQFRFSKVMIQVSLQI